jgi:hypothetical protein
VVVDVHCDVRRQFSGLVAVISSKELKHNEFRPIAQEYENRPYMQYGRPRNWLHDARLASAHSLWRLRRRMAVRAGHLSIGLVLPSSPKEIMKIYSNTVIIGALLLLTFSALARDHSALNGAWTLVPAKSDFAGQPVVQTGTVTISDRQGIIIVSRNFMYQGASETYFYKDITDAENNATIHSGKDVKSKTRWDHDALKVTTTESGAITVESYTLAVDGTMLVSVARPQHSPITLVFQRQ